jgi:hypothetical protein
MSRETEIRRAKDALARGDATDAERQLDAILREGPDAADALRSRASARVRVGNWGGAADDLERMFRAAPAEATPVDVEYARVLRLAQSLPPDKAVQLVADFDYGKLADAVSLTRAGRTWSLEDFASRAASIASEKYAPAEIEHLKQYVAAKIPGRLYRVPALQTLPAMDAWSHCEWWVHHGLGAADAVHEIATGEDVLGEAAEVPPAPYRAGFEAADLAKRCPVEWAFVHHALIVMAYDLAEELADEAPQLRPELPAVRDAVVKPLLYMGFGIGLEGQGI